MNQALFITDRSAKGAMEIEAQLSVPVATTQFVHYHFAEPPDSKLYVEGKFRVELCLNSRHRSARLFPRSMAPVSLRTDR